MKVHVIGEVDHQTYRLTVDRERTSLDRWVGDDLEGSFEPVTISAEEQSKIAAMLAAHGKGLVRQKLGLKEPDTQ